MAHATTWPDDVTEDQVRRVLEAANIRPDTMYMAVPRCDTCAHWEDDYDRDGKRPCGVTPDHQGKGGPSTLVEIDDPYCCMLTEAHFGCVEWKAKEEATER